MVVATRRSGGFSLIELVIVVVIIGIIGAIAIPRMSRGAEGAGDSALAGDLSVLRSAIDLYATEHGGKYPLIGVMPAALLQYSNDAGATNGTKSALFPYGPYLRAVPPLPVGASKGQTGIAAAYVALAPNGWVYDDVEGTIISHTGPAEADSKGKLYTAY